MQTLICRQGATVEGLPCLGLTPYAFQKQVLNLCAINEEFTCAIYTGQNNMWIGVCYRIPEILQGKIIIDSTITFELYGLLRWQQYRYTSACIAILLSLVIRQNVASMPIFKCYKDWILIRLVCSQMSYWCNDIWQRYGIIYFWPQFSQS